MAVLRRVCILLLLVCLLCGMACALETEVDPEQGLSGNVVDEVGEFGQGQELGDTALNLLKNALGSSGSSLKNGLQAGAVILAVMILCGLFETSAASAAAIVGSLVITAACFGNLQTMISLGTNTITTINEYSVFLLPSLTALLAASGGFSASAALYVGSMFFLELLMTLIAKLLVPLIYVFIAISAAEAALDNDLLSKLREFVKWLMTASLKLVMYVFTGFLTVTGILSGTADAAKLKAAKLTLSGTVPVVGSIISDASDAVLSSAAVLKNAIGTYGMLAVLAICLLPFLRIAVQYLVMKGVAAVSGMVGRSCHVKLVENMAAAMGLLLGMTGAYALMCLLCITLCLKAVGL